MSNFDGGPVFPALPEHGLNSRMPGMSLRDYFAARAMQSFMAWALEQRPFDGYETASKCCEAYAKHAYAIADAMLAEREKAGAQ